MNLLDSIQKAVRVEAQALGALAERVDQSAVQAVHMLADCRGRVIVGGMGKAGLIGRKIAATFSSTGTPSIFLHPAEAMHGDLGLIGPDDVALIVSSSGETEEVLALLPHVKRAGAPVIALTGKPESTLGRLADIVLDVGVEREACPMGCAPMAATTAALAMGDALAAGLIVKRGFTKEHFAIFHPGGSLGRKLLLYVRELMATGEELPLATAGAVLKDAVLEMSSKKLGAVFVVDDEMRLLGIYTDGDLRRTLEKELSVEILSKVMGEIMTPKPTAVSGDILAAEALRLMEQRSITALPVVDEEQRVVGALHMHALIKAGLA